MDQRIDRARPGDRPSWAKTAVAVAVMTPLALRAEERARRSERQRLRPDPDRKRAMFEPQGSGWTERGRRIWATYEILYTLAEFVAGLCFVTGSLLFLAGGHDLSARCLFLGGSMLFALKPTLRLLREFAFLRDGKVQDLADRAWRAP